MSSLPGAAFVWADGARIAGTQIWCDARRGPATDAWCFVSHAHHPVAWRGSTRVRVLAHPRTLVLAAASGSAAGLSAEAALPSAFCRPFALGRLRLELLPSGHVPGGAQLLVETPGRRVLYAGDVNPRPGRTVEPPQLRGADAVCLDAPLAPLTIGRGLPPRDEVERALVDAVDAALRAGEVPVVLVPPLGGAGEVAALLLAAGLEVRAHRRIVAVLASYERLGIALGGRVQRLRGGGDTDAVGADIADGGRRSRVVLWPIDARHPPPVGNTRRLVVDGQAIDPAFIAQHGGAAGFPLSDHGDLPALVTFAADVGAKEVWLTSGFTDGVARAFAARGMRAQPLTRPSQMPLRL